MRGRRLGMSEAPPSAGAARATDLVIVGASSGGIDALSRLVKSLPTDFPAPVVIAQHVDPERVSHLAEILAARSTVPVRMVMDQDALEAGVVYVVPENRDIQITDHHVALRSDMPGRPKPSIDLLLTS